MAKATNEQWGVWSDDSEDQCDQCETRVKLTAWWGLYESGSVWSKDQNNPCVSYKAPHKSPVFF